MKNKWFRLIVCSLLAVFLLNSFHAFFLYQKEFNSITITYTVEADFNTATWLTYTPRYSEENNAKDTIRIEKNTLVVVTNTFNIQKGFNDVSIYWSRADRGKFSVKDVFVSSGKKTWNFEQISKVVSYASSNVVSEATNETLVNTAKTKGNGWLMLDVLAFENIARSKQFKPLQLTTNLALFILCLVLGYFYGSRAKKLLNSLNVEGVAMLKIKMFILYVWMFLLPFWLGASHIFMALALAATILHYRTEKGRFTKKSLKTLLPFLILFAGILLINSVYHPTEFLNDLADYSYFFFTPFLFLGLERQQLIKIVHLLEIAISGYVLLLIVSIIERYLTIDGSYLFTTFFFETIDQYWHTSYLAVLICVLLLFRVYTKPITAVFLILTMSTFVFLYFSQARLPLFLTMALMVGVMLLKFPKKKKRIFGVSILAASVGVLLFCSIYPYYGNKLVNSFLVNDAQKEDARPILWSTSLEIAKENLITGIGRSAIRDQLSENIDANSDIKFRRYNAHNQYLEFLLAYGILIPALFLLVLLFPIFKKYKATTLFVVYFSLAMTVESYLSRQAGVVLFTFFYGLFMMYDYKNKKHMAASSK